MPARSTAKTIAHQPGVDDVSGRLSRAGAPKELVRRAKGRSVDDLWDASVRPDHLLWLAVVQGVPLATLVDATAAAVTLVVAARRDGATTLTEAMAVVAEMRSARACAEAAVACDEAAGARGPGGYRDGLDSPEAWAARATGDLCRAAEALLGAETRRVSARESEGKARAAMLGVGDQIMWHGDLEPLRFDADDELAHGCVFACEGALEASLRSLAGPAATPERNEDVAAELANAMFEILDPVREGLQRGDLSRVRSVQARLSVESSDPIRNPKKPIVATAAALIFPIGGGHYHADHPWVGAALTAGTVAAFVLGFPLAVAFIALSDAALARDAVRRRNAGRSMRGEQQAVLGLSLSFAAIALAMVIDQLS